MTKMSIKLWTIIKLAHRYGGASRPWSQADLFAWEDALASCKTLAVSRAGEQGLHFRQGGGILLKRPNNCSIVKAKRYDYVNITSFSSIP